MQAHLFVVPPLARDGSVTICPAVVALDAEQAIACLKYAVDADVFCPPEEAVNVSEQFGERVPDREVGVPFLFAF